MTDLDVMKTKLAGVGDGPGPEGPLGPAVARKPRRRRLLLWLAAGWLLLVILVAVLAPVLPVKNPDLVGSKFSVRPGFHLDPLGTDNLGRSELSRIVFGARVTLTVGFGATFGAMVVGIAIGMVAGYFRGFVDGVVDIFTNTLLAFPPLIFLLGMATILKPNPVSLAVALGVLAVPQFARVSRANTLNFVNREFIQASRAMGASHARILFRDLLPLVVLPVLTFSLLVMATLIVAEGSLSFLGLGVQPPKSSWGTMISAGRTQLDTTPHLVFVPAVFFFLTVAALNVVGDWARARAGREVAL